MVHLYRYSTCGAKHHLNILLVWHFHLNERKIYTSDNKWGWIWSLGCPRWRLQNISESISTRCHHDVSQKFKSFDYLVSGIRSPIRYNPLSQARSCIFLHFGSYSYNGVRLPKHGLFRPIWKTLQYIVCHNNDTILDGFREIFIPLNGNR